jgi:hypothetical protein
MSLHRRPPQDRLLFDLLQTEHSATATTDAPVARYASAPAQERETDMAL